MSVRDSPGKFFFFKPDHHSTSSKTQALVIEKTADSLSPCVMNGSFTQKVGPCKKLWNVENTLQFLLARQFFRFPCLPHHETPLRNRTTTSLSASKKSTTYTFFGNQPEENIYIKKDQSKYWLKVREIKTRKNNKLNSGIDITFSKRRENYCIPHPSLEVTYV